MDSRLFVCLFSFTHQSLVLLHQKCGDSVLLSLASIWLPPSPGTRITGCSRGAVVDVVPYARFLGLLCAGLPTVTKVALRTFEHE